MLFISPNHSIDIPHIFQSVLQFGPHLQIIFLVVSPIQIFCDANYFAFPYFILPPKIIFPLFLYSNCWSLFRMFYFLINASFKSVLLTCVNPCRYHCLSSIKHLKSMRLCMTIFYIGLRLYTLQHTSPKQYMAYNRFSNIYWIKTFRYLFIQ